MGRKRAGWRRVPHWLAIALVLGWLAFLRPTSLGGPASYMVVMGNSMEPTLSHGTLIVSLSEPSYKVGDIVTFTPPAGHGGAPLVVHRLIESADDGYLTRGDNNAAADPWTLPSTMITGRPVISIPGVGGLVSAARTPLFMAGLGGTLAALTLLGLASTARSKTHVPARAL